jgi:hypothetical protein
MVIDIAGSKAQPYAGGLIAANLVGAFIERQSTLGK